MAGFFDLLFNPFSIFSFFAPSTSGTSSLIWYVAIGILVIIIIILVLFLLLRRRKK